MARVRVVGRWIPLLLMVWAVLLWSVVVVGAGDPYWDPPGPPPIDVYVDVSAVELLQDQDDGIDGNAELVLVIEAKSEIGSGRITVEKDDMNWDEKQVWSVTKSILIGTECSPPSRIVISASLAESDNGTTDQVINILKTAAQAALLRAWKGWPAAAGSIAGGVLTAGLLYLNGDDDLGSGAIAIEGEKEGIIPLDGPDGSAQVRIKVRTIALPDKGQCDTPPKQVPEERVKTEYDKKKIIAKVFEPLEESYWTIFYEVDYEKGNPAGLSRSQVLAVQRSLLSYYLRWPESIAASLIADAYKRGADVSNAVRDYLQGMQYAKVAMQTRDQEKRDVSTERALKAFRSAALKAASASYSNAGVGVGVLNTSAERLPFHIVIVPDYFSTDVGRSPEFPVFVFGADDPVTLSVSDTPVGMNVTTERLDPELPLFRMKVDLSDATPGQYVLRLNALSGGKETTMDFTLVVN